MNTVKVKSIGKVRLNKRLLIFVCLLLPHMKPRYFDTIPTIDIFFDLWRIISFGYAAARILFIRKRCSPLAGVLLVLCAYLLGNTIAKEGDIHACFLSVFSIAAVALIYECFSDELWGIIEAQLYCFELLLYINLVTVILYPDGLFRGEFVISRNYFLGFYNNLSAYYYPALVTVLLYTYKTGKRVRTTLLIIIIFSTALLTWSGGILAALFAAAFVFVFWKNKIHIFNYYSYWLLQIIFFVGVILFRLQKYLYWAIEGILGKWQSLLLRMELWDWVMKKIMQSIWTGYGVYSSPRWAAMYGKRWTIHAHNFILQIFFEGGLVYFLFMIIIILLAGKRLYQYRQTYCVKVISLGFLAWSIQNMVEPLSTPFLMGMFVLAYYCDRLVEVSMEQKTSVILIKE